MKKNWKAAARKLGALLFALVLIVSAVTPARQAYALETGTGSILDGALGAMRGQEESGTGEVPEDQVDAENTDNQEPADSVDPQPSDEEPANGGLILGDDSMSLLGVSDAEAAAETQADVTVEQGGSVTYNKINNAFAYTYSAPAGLTVEKVEYSNVLRISAAEDMEPGIYEVTYGRYISRSFTVEVTEAKDDGGSTGGTGTVTPPAVQTQDMALDKTAELRTDGAYDLTLSLSGSVGSQTNKKKVDVVFIVDNSNSMYKRTQFMANLKDPMKALVDNLDGNEGIDARYAIAMFGTNSEIRQTFTNAATVKNTIGDIEAYSTLQGGTNYEAGIYQGKQILNTKRTDAITIVIFVTDGEPTYRGAPNKDGGTGSDDNDGLNIAAAVSRIRNMNCNYFYCIGIGDDFTNTNSTEYSNMAQLTGAVHAITDTGIHAVDDNNVSALTDYFNKITADITSFMCSNVVVTDTLSSNVSGELMVQVTNPESVMVSVEKDGAVIAGPAASVDLAKTEHNEAATLSATYADGVLKLNFPTWYKLEPGYTYKLHAVIAPTEAAYEKYRAEGYTNTADAGTGTHSGEKGVFCNEGATVTYDYKGTAGSAAYPHPVVQLNPGMLQITKKIEGMTADQLSGLTFTANLTYPGGKTEVRTFKLEECPFDGETYTYSAYISGLSPNTQYTVTESGREVEYYNVTTTVDGAVAADPVANGSVPGGETVTVAYVNSYEIAVTSLTLDKVVTGNMGDWEKDFTFTITVDGEVFQTVTMNHNTPVKTFEVPIGSQIVITESGNENYNVSATVDGSAATVTDSSITIEKVASAGHAVVFTNDFHQNVDTGIELDSMPYVMMLLVCAAAGFFFLARKRMAFED